MRDHSNVIRYALMASYLNVRAMEVTDDITRMAIDRGNWKWRNFQSQGHLLAVSGYSLCRQKSAAGAEV